VTTFGYLTTVQLNGEPVAVYRPADQCAPALVTVAARVTLTLDEVAAVLFEFTWSLAQPMEDLADDARVRVLVAEAVVNWGCDELDEVRRNVTAAVASSGEAAELLAQCRNRASAVFAPTGAPTRTS
jgi:hypothetical protein